MRIASRGRTRIPACLAGTLVLASLVACGGGDSPASAGPPATAPPAPPQAPPVSYWAGTNGLKVPTGYVAVFAAREVRSNSPVAATWGISGEGCTGSGCGSIDSQGMYFAPSTVPNPSRIIVTATSVRDSTVLGQAPIDIVPTAGGHFTLTGSLISPRAGHTATLLPDGRVLITGGSPNGPDAYNLGTPLSSAELFDPGTGTFSQTGDMKWPRAGHSATLLENGKVLIVGPGDELSAELYDPATGQFSATGTRHAMQRGLLTANRLPGGKVLVASGPNAELYDPETGLFVPAPAYSEDLVGVTGSVALSNGKVLVTSVRASQIYDPTTNSFAIAEALRTRNLPLLLFGATSLADGSALITGGGDGLDSDSYADAYRFDAGSSHFVPTGPMLLDRSSHSAVRLADGRVLVLGGFSYGLCGNCYFGAMAGAEIYDPEKGEFSPTGRLNKPRRMAQATLLQDGSVLVTGGVRDCDMGCSFFVNIPHPDPVGVSQAEVFHVEN